MSSSIQIVPERISNALKRVLVAADAGNLTIGQIVDILKGRGVYMIVILLWLPFLSPVSVPGISMPFGFAIAFSGLRIAFGREPWVPDWILRKSLPPRVLEKILKVGIRLHERLERIIKPRLSPARCRQPRRAFGAAIDAAPVPATNPA